MKKWKKWKNEKKWKKKWKNEEKWKMKNEKMKKEEKWRKMKKWKNEKKKKIEKMKTWKKNEKMKTWKKKKNEENWKNEKMKKWKKNEKMKKNEKKMKKWKNEKMKKMKKMKKKWKRKKGPSLLSAIAGVTGTASDNPRIDRRSCQERSSKRNEWPWRHECSWVGGRILTVDGRWTWDLHQKCERALFWKIRQLRNSMICMYRHPRAWLWDVCCFTRRGSSWKSAHPMWE